jgi:hypothetical protein
MKSSGETTPWVSITIIHAEVEEEVFKISKGGRTIICLTDE